MRLILSWAGETLAASTFLKQMNPQEEKKKVNYSKQKRPAPCPEPIWTLTFHTLIGLVGLACVNEAFHLPLFLPMPLSSFYYKHRESLRENTLGFRDFSF